MHYELIGNEVLTILYFTAAPCVRDWSGILCELFRTTDNGQHITVFFLSEEKTKASKDIAESPTAIAGTP